MSQKVADFDQFQIRLPGGMRSRIKAAAEANGRSMNSEIVATLEEAYPADRTIIDTIFFAKQILNEYRDAPDLPRLRELRHMLGELVQQLEGVRAIQNAPEDQDPDA